MLSVRSGLPLAVLAASFAAHGGMAQTTTVVSGGGPALANAVQAAQPGDTLIVRAARYDPIVVTRGIRILCDPGVVVRPASPGSVVSVDVRGVPTGQELVIHGMSLPGQGFAFPPPTPYVLSVTGCAGRVVLQRLSFTEAQWNYNAYATIADCGDLSLNDCLLSQVLVARSTISLASCTTNRPTNALPPRGTLSVSNSSVFVNGGSIFGGQSSISFFEAYPGIHATASTLTLAGAARVAGGTFGQVFAPAIEADASTRIHLGPKTSITAGVTPPIRGGVTLAEPLPGVSVRNAVAGGVATFTTTGQPGTLVASLLSWNAAPFPLPFGTLWIDTAAPVFDLGPMPSSGDRSVTTPVPPPLARESLTAQAIALGTTPNDLFVGAPTRFVVQ